MNRPQVGSENLKAHLSHGLKKPLASVWLLGLTQIIGYGSLFYAFPILASSIAQEFGWKTSSVFGLFSISLLAGGAASPLIGRMMDRLGAARIMVWGSLLAALALVFLSLAPASLFFPGLIILEIASAMALYDAAFATLAQRTGGEARNRIAQMTLIAGFASSISWPVTDFLHRLFDWREVLFIFALLHLGFCLPIHRLLQKLPCILSQAADAAEASQPGISPAELRGRILWLAAFGFAFSGFLMSGVLTLMVPLLTQLGLGAAAVLVAALFGPAQVASRIVLMALGRRLPPVLAAGLASGFMGLACCLLLGMQGEIAIAIGFAILFGLGSGITSIVRGTVPLVLFGSAHYGRVLGKMALVRLVLNAAAPFSFAYLLEQYGASPALLSVGFVGFLGVAAFVLIAMSLAPKLKSGQLKGTK